MTETTCPPVLPEGFFWRVYENTGLFGKRKSLRAAENMGMHSYVPREDESVRENIEYLTSRLYDRFTLLKAREAEPDYSDTKIEGALMTVKIYAVYDKYAPAVKIADKVVPVVVESTRQWEDRDALAAAIVRRGYVEVEPGVFEFDHFPKDRKGRPIARTLEAQAQKRAGIEES